jgi:hypothetical protein
VITRGKAQVLTLEVISNDLNLKAPQDVFKVFNSSVSTAMEDFKKQFQGYIENQLLSAEDERRELLLVVASELKSIMWNARLLKMLHGDYKIFNEFCTHFAKGDYFGCEIDILRFLKPLDIMQHKERFLEILNSLNKIFENTNSAKYSSRDTWFDMFSSNIMDEFEKYPYICWEQIVCELKHEKPSEFPCLNDILKRLEKIKISLPLQELSFLKTIKVI